MRTSLILALTALVSTACGALPGIDATNDALTDITEPTTLEDRVEDPNEPDYFVLEDITVGARLEIEPGVVIAFARDTQMTVAGRDGGALVARGLEDAPIVFRGQDATPGFWAGIYVDNSESSENTLDHVVVEHGGGREFGAGLGAANLGLGGFVGVSTFAITNSTFRDSAGFGIEVEGDTRLTSFGSNTFEGNAAFDVRIPVEELRQLDADSTFDTSPGVEVFKGEATTAGTWRKLQTSVAVTGDIELSARFVLEPGVSLELGDNVAVTVRGRDEGVLVAQGTADDPITFGRLGGVIWRGLYIDNSQSSENVLEHVTFSHGGFTAFEGDQQALLTIGGFVGTSAISVRDCTFQNSAGAGIYIESDNMINADIADANTFSDNAGGSVVIQD